MVQGPRPWLFPGLVEISRSWMAECVTCQDHAFPSSRSPRDIAAMQRSASTTRSFARPVGIVAWWPCSSHTTPWVRQSGWTSTRRSQSGRPTPIKCHVNYTVADSRWEHVLDLTLEEIPEVLRYVKNQGSASSSRTASTDSRRRTTRTSSSTRRWPGEPTIRCTSSSKYPENGIGRSRSRWTRLARSLDSRRQQCRTLRTMALRRSHRSLRGCGHHPVHRC